jgi:hypothetical protein
VAQEHAYNSKYNCVVSSDEPIDALPPFPRMVRLKRRIVVVFWTTFVALFGLGELLAVFARAEVGKLERLAHDGVATTGKITEMNEHRGNSSTDHQIRFEFTVDGVGVKGFQAVDDEVAGKYRVGDALPITYLPSDPKIHRAFAVDAAAARKKANHVRIFEIVALAILALIFGSVGAVYLKRLKLARRGHLFEAFITRVGEPKGKKGIREIEFEVAVEGRPHLQLRDFAAGHLFSPSDVGRKTGYLALDERPDKGLLAVTPFRSCELE